MDFLKTQFDKLLMTGFAVFLLILLALLLSFKLDGGVVAWLEKSIDMVTGSLLTMVTGQLLRNLNGKD
jgi:hypothetical protein